MTSKFSTKSQLYTKADRSSNPVRAAYTASLESQISSLRDELAAVYKTQGQNAQRLLAMNETLREKEEQLRIETQNYRRTSDDLAVLSARVNQHAELMAEKDRTAQVSTLLDRMATYLRLLRSCTMRLLLYSWN
jgi:autophagy-related protein 16